MKHVFWSKITIFTRTWDAVDSFIRNVTNVKLRSCNLSIRVHRSIYKHGLGLHRWLQDVSGWWVTSGGSSARLTAGWMFRSQLNSGWERDVSLSLLFDAGFGHDVGIALASMSRHQNVKKCSAMLVTCPANSQWNNRSVIQLTTRATNIILWTVIKFFVDMFYFID